MITVTLGHRQLGIDWEREYRQEEQVVNGETKVVKTPIALYCNLHRLNKDGKSEAIVARTRARCSPKEHFKYEVGRRIALARALKQYGLGRGERTLVWLAYLDRPRTVSVKPQPVEEAITLINVVDDSPLHRRLRNIIAGVPFVETQQADGFREPEKVPLSSLDFHAGEV